MTIQNNGDYNKLTLEEKLALEAERGYVEINGVFTVYDTHGQDAPDHELEIERRRLRLAWAIVGNLIAKGSIRVNMLDEANTWHELA